MFRLNKFSEEQLKTSSPKPAVFLLHGHLDSSDGWIANGERSVPFILAEAGYDVYMGNSRGNKYSTSHVRYNSRTDTAYWDGCIPDNQAKYDVPAFMEKIKELSNVENLTVLSHSMGARSMILNLELDPEYFGKNINYLVLLSPFTQLNRLTLINKVILEGNNFIDNYFPKQLNWHRSFRNPGLITEGFKYVCGYQTWYCEFLSKFMDCSTLEFNDREAFKVYFTKYPA